MSRKVGLKQAKMLPRAAPTAPHSCLWFFAEVDEKTWMARMECGICINITEPPMTAWFTSLALEDLFYASPAVMIECVRRHVLHKGRQTILALRSEVVVEAVLQKRGDAQPSSAKEWKRQVLQSSMRNPNDPCSHCHATASCAQDNTSQTKGVGINETSNTRV